MTANGGANQHMGKPFSPVALRSEVEALLEG